MATAADSPSSWAKKHGPLRAFCQASIGTKFRKRVAWTDCFASRAPTWAFAWRAAESYMTVYWPSTIQP